MMLQNLQPEVPVYIIGNRVQLKSVQAFDTSRKIGVLPSIPARLTDTIFSKLLPPSSRKSLHADDDATHLTPDHPFSVIEISTPGRLTRIHPSALQIETPVALGRYGVCRVEGEFIKKYVESPPYIKIFESVNDPNAVPHGSNFIAEALISDLDQEAQIKFCNELRRYVSEQFLGASAHAQSAKAASDFDRIGGAGKPFKLPPAGNEGRAVAKTTDQLVQDDAESVRTQAQEAYEYASYVSDELVKTSKQAVARVKSFLSQPGVRAALAFILAMIIGMWILAKVIEVVGEPSPDDDISKASQESLRRLAPHKFK
jgi:hypothetical protein